MEYYPQEARSLDGARGVVDGEVCQREVRHDHAEPYGQQFVGLHVLGYSQDDKTQPHRHQEDVAPLEIYRPHLAEVSF